MTIAAFFLFVSCSPQSQLNRAKKLEQKGRYEKAWHAYQQVAAKNPETAQAPEALYRAGLVARKRLGDCYIAETFFDRVMQQYPQSDWAKPAGLQKQNCPDYFPLVADSQWTEVDSETKGKNARIEIRCKGLADEAEATLARTYFAGDKEVSQTQFLYKKANGELVEYQSEKDPIGKVILKWPAKVGAKWRTTGYGKAIDYEIKSMSEKVKVEAGEFTDCLKVQSSIVGLGGASTFEYYAPGVGRVLTTVSGKGDAEQRITELKFYRPAASENL